MPQRLGDRSRNTGIPPTDSWNKSPVEKISAPALLLLFPDNRLNGALFCTGAAIHAKIRINTMFLRIFAYCRHWTLIDAAPAGDTVVGDEICHFVSFVSFIGFG